MQLRGSTAKKYFRIAEPLNHTGISKMQLRGSAAKKYFEFISRNILEFIARNILNLSQEIF
jgi:hypothetical protein